MSQDAMWRHCFLTAFYSSKEAGRITFTTGTAPVDRSFEECGGRGSAPSLRSPRPNGKQGCRRLTIFCCVVCHTTTTILFLMGRSTTQDNKDTATQMCPFVRGIRPLRRLSLSTLAYLPGCSARWGSVLYAFSLDHNSVLHFPAA